MAPPDNPLSRTRAAVAEAERRAAQAEQLVREQKNERRVAWLEREVDALLSPEPGHAESFYIARAKEVEQALTAARARRDDLEARLLPPGGVSEMERARSAALAGAARDEERELAAERADIMVKLERLRAR